MLTGKVATAFFVLAASAFGQAANPRYELGLRLRELERAWQTVSAWSADSKAIRCKLAVPHIEQAVQSFFGGDAGAAGKALDDARDDLLTGGDMRWLDGLAITPARRLCDMQENSLGVELRWFYGEWQPASASSHHTSVAGPPTLEFKSGVAGSAESLLKVDLAFPTEELPAIGNLPLGSLAAGDQQLWTSLLYPDSAQVNRTLTISIVEKRDERLAALEKAINELPASAPRLERETATALLALLKSLAIGSTEETDFPAARLLAESELVVAAAAKDATWYGPEHAGEFWLALPTGAKPSRVRVLVPSGLQRDKPVPLVVALHGAGGSENMFFDTYGAGAIVKLCEQRGWLLVAPRVALLGGAPVHAIVDALRERYPVDTTRVLLVGHSMGAGAGISVVQKDPSFFRAFAALGGGQSVKEAEKLANRRVFIGAGESDFGRKGAESLHASLVAGGSKVASLKVYPNCEHLMVVADALPDVFAFFDGALSDK